MKNSKKSIRDKIAKNVEKVRILANSDDEIMKKTKDKLILLTLDMADGLLNGKRCQIPYTIACSVIRWIERSDLETVKQILNQISASQDRDEDEVGPIDDGEIIEEDDEWQPEPDPGDLCYYVGKSGKEKIPCTVISTNSKKQKAEIEFDDDDVETEWVPFNQLKPQWLTQPSKTNR